MHPKAAPALSAVLAGLVLASLAALAPSAPARAAAPEGELHVPSPDWRDQVVYFVMIDRFADGDPGNNDQGAGEYDPADNAKYSGGDLPGIARRLDYIQGLGATALWITPPVANQWWNPRHRYGGYHGYWASDFMAVDAHYGTLADYRALSRALHGRGMYLVQDVVVNHVADYFGHDAGWNRADPVENFVLHPDARGRTAPVQAPFHLNDVRNPAHRAAGIYHWTPVITDYGDPEQERTFQLAGLDDLDTGNPVVRDALRQSYGFWIRQAGVDGFRVDTAFYVAPEYFADFLHADDADFPGIARVAAATGRDDFHVFGEGFGIDRPGEDAQARKIDAYMRSQDGTPLLPGMINFPLHGTLVDVFARGRPSADLGFRIDNMMAVHARPHLMPTFLDNHDVDRFLAGGSEAGLRQGLLALMTLPGIPVIYYGTGQGFTGQRAAMFAAGYGAGARDHFDTAAPLYRYLQRAIALRRTHTVLSRGVPTVLAANPAAPGAVAWRMDYDPTREPSSPPASPCPLSRACGGEGWGEGGSSNPHATTALVVFNTADQPTLLDNLDPGLPPGTILEGLFGIDATPGPITVGANGRLQLLLPPRSGQVWRTTPRTAPPPPASTTLAIDPLATSTFQRDFQVSGTAAGPGGFQLVIDGNLTTAQTVRAGPDGRWQATIDTGDMVDPAVRHTVVAWVPSVAATAPMQISGRREFTVEKNWTVLANVDDPPGDDAGPGGRYTYPTDPGWGDHRQLDLRHVRVSGAGGALQLQLRMHDVTAAWNPPNGFDHVAFTVFVEVPGRNGGSRVMPLQRATLPGAMRWHYRLRTHGWTNAAFAPSGAGAGHEGTPANPGATIHADPATDTIVLTFPAAALGHLDSLSGVKLYINTWDWDGGYRALTPQPQGMAFGGGDGARDALVMDDTAVIVLP